MPSLARTLQEEIRRLTKKEIKAAVSPLVKENRGLRREVEGLKRRLSSTAAARGPGRPAKAASAKTGEKEPSTQITSAMIKRFRKRHGLSQAMLGDLIGVSAQSVYQWENKSGPLKLRSRTQNALDDVLGLSKSEIEERLGETKKTPRRGRRKTSAKKTASKTSRKTAKKTGKKTAKKASKKTTKKTTRKSASKKTAKKKTSKKKPGRPPKKKTGTPKETTAS